MGASAAVRSAFGPLVSKQPIGDGVQSLPGAWFEFPRIRWRASWGSCWKRWFKTQVNSWLKMLVAAVLQGFFDCGEILLRGNLQVFCH